MDAATVTPLPPGPREFPLVGTPAPLLGSRDMVAMATRQWERFGDVSRMNLFGRSLVMITHPDHLMHVLKTRQDVYVKGSTYDPVRRLLGDSLVTLDGAPWQHRRKLAAPAFHPRSLRELTGVMAGTGARFLDGVAETAGPEGAVLDAEQLMSELTLTVAVDALFGRDLIDISRDVSFDALRASLEVASRDGQGIPLPSWIPTPNNRRFVSMMRDLDATIYRIIDAGRRRPPGDTGSMLAQLLDARNDDGRPLSEKALRDEVFTMFMAGHETTALTLTWTLALLQQHPDVLERVTAEIRGEIGDREPRFDDAVRLPYLRQVLDESLRLRPPAPAVARTATVPDEIGGYRVEPGDTVLVMIWLTHRHPGFWPDAERFDPERFGPEHARERHAWSYVPFSRGPRICIGNTFSLVESAILMAQLFQRFDVDVLPCDDVRPKAVWTVKPSAPVRVRLTPRQGWNR